MHRLPLFGALALMALGATTLAAGQQAPAPQRSATPAASAVVRPSPRPAAPRSAVERAAAAGRATAQAPLRATTPPVFPGTSERAFTTIQGNALNSTNGALVNGSVRLRDARYGRIVDSQTTDQSGLFAFRRVDPGSYIVELLGPSESVLAASQILNVSAGDVISAIVKLPFRIPPFAGLFGRTSQASAASLMSTAVSSGVMTIIAPGVPVSPQ